MRIISGSKRGQKIIYPKNSNIRPTTDFAKEALFNILNNNYQFSKINVLDLFAGSGNISFEFASRGCKNITCIDINKSIINSLKKSKEKFNQLKRGNFFIETAKNFNNLYGSPLKNINKSIKKNHHILFDIDWKGARKIRRN